MNKIIKSLITLTFLLIPIFSINANPVESSTSFCVHFESIDCNWDPISITSNAVITLPSGTIINITYNNDVDLIVISSEEVLEDISFYCEFYSDGEIVYTSPEINFLWMNDLWPQSAEVYSM